MRRTKAYMRLVEPGKKADTTVSDKLRRYVNQYVEKIQAAIDGGMSADEAFKKIKPSVSRLEPDDLIALWWENQYLGEWDIPKGSVNLLYALEGILQKAIYTTAVQWWGSQKTERKRQTDPKDETVVTKPKDTTQDDVGTKVETPAKAAAVKDTTMIKYAGHLYREAKKPLSHEEQILLLKNVREWNKWYTGAGDAVDLEGSDLSGMSLRGVLLYNADLTAANLEGTDLERSDLHGTVFHGSWMKNANLRRANLNDAYLTSAILIGADLYGSKLVGTDLRGARLPEANLEKALLTEAVYDLHTRFPVDFDPESAGMKYKSSWRKRSPL